MGMTKSYAKDIQLLLAILRNQDNIKKVIERFNCNQNNLEKDTMAFDLCSFYMAQIGESAKLLTEESKSALSCLDAGILKYFRNQIDHVYEKVNKTYLKPFIFAVISKEAILEVKDRIKYCTNQTKESE
ncbi:MAG: hypothetical protein IJ420_05845 [Lachnospiraceae bacterium]|nr:hypothetical protein [Lachnospiraceae bacterium]